MGLLHLKHIDKAIEDRKRVFRKYNVMLSEVSGIEIFASVLEEESGDTKNNYAYLPILIQDEYPLSRDELYEKLAAQGIHARKYFYPITADQACFKNRYKKILLPVARMMAKKILVLPIYDGMEEKFIDSIVKLVRNESLKF